MLLKNVFVDASSYTAFFRFFFIQKHDRCPVWWIKNLELINNDYKLIDKNHNKLTKKQFDCDKILRLERN